MAILSKSARQKQVQAEIKRTPPDEMDEDEKYKDLKIDFEGLCSLSNLGIKSDGRQFQDVAKDDWLAKEAAIAASGETRNTWSAQQAQNYRLSKPTPMYLFHAQHATVEEAQIAHPVTVNLAKISKQLLPVATADPHGQRKVMGLSSVGLESRYDPNMLSVVTSVDLGIGYWLTAKWI